MLIRKECDSFINWNRSCEFEVIYFTYNKIRSEHLYESSLRHWTPRLFKESHVSLTVASKKSCWQIKQRQEKGSFPMTPYFLYSHIPGWGYAEQIIKAIWEGATNGKSPLPQIGTAEGRVKNSCLNRDLNPEATIQMQAR